MTEWRIRISHSVTSKGWRAETTVEVTTPDAELDWGRIAHELAQADTVARNESEQRNRLDRGEERTWD